MTRTVPLGFAVGTGEPVAVPMQHMVITGQTQQAGKTTALEALVERSRVRAIAFVTKRGEGSFTNARVIPPYFREQADWKYVASILEASRGEKMRFERSWIIRASKGAQSLMDVHANVKRLLEKATGIHADVYLTLDAYLDDVVPLIETVQWAKRVELASGLNVMDLTGLNVEMQHLVIRSTIDWVLNHESNTVVVVPEAWKFIPQGRGTPVKLAAEGFIRQAAGLQNYLWLDSQDIAGVEKMILKSVPVWILGVQRESNEIKRTLDQIPAGIAKPKPAQIATLGLGQFFACYGTHVTHVYVQPSWLSEKDAKNVAVGKAAAHPPTAPVRAEEPTVTEAEARQLRDENIALRRQLETLTRELEALKGRANEPERKEPTRYPAPPAESLRSNGATPAATDDEQALADRVLQLILARDPAPIIRLLQTRPQLDIEVERKTVTIDGTSVKGRVARLLSDGFFSTGRRQGEARAELKKTGTDINPGTLSKVFTELVVDGFLINQGSSRYVADPRALVRVVEK